MCLVADVTVPQPRLFPSACATANAWNIGTPSWAEEVAVAGGWQNTAKQAQKDLVFVRASNLSIVNTPTLLILPIDPFFTAHYLPLGSELHTT